jgi:hypothetical protein
MYSRRKNQNQRLNPGAALNQRRIAAGLCIVDKSVSSAQNEVWPLLKMKMKIRLYLSRPTELVLISLILFT